VYEGDLTKQITHLISFRTEGAKYKAAKSWGLRIVSIEWLRDSLERGMILDEKLYDPALPETERGKDAWDRTKPKRTSLGKRSRVDSAANSESGKRKLRRTASTKLATQNETIWGDLTGGVMVPQVSRSGIWVTDDVQPAPLDIQSKTRIPADTGHTESLQSTIENESLKKGIFTGCRFYVHGFPPARTQTVQDHLSARDAEVLSTLEDLAVLSQNNLSRRVFRIVPHNLPVSQHPELPKSRVPVETITEWWLERCLHHKNFFDPNEHVIGRPFPVFPIEGFAGMTISSSAFAGIDLLHFTNAVRLIGAAYGEDMTPQSTVLVTKSMVGLRKDKFDHAQEWNVPIVTGEWLWDSISAGARLPFQKYRCRSQKRSVSLPRTNEDSLKSAASRPEQSKSEFVKALSRSRSHSSKLTAKPPPNAKLDNTAFMPDESIVKKEHETKNLPSTIDGSDPTTEELSCKTEPLSERSLNSPSRTVSTAPAPSDHPIPKPQEDISDAISSLLAKTKNAKDQPQLLENVESRKRGANRILGRVTSNISTGSNGRSRATSVDSTATHGHPVQYSTYIKPGGGSDQTANERIEMLINGDRNINKDIDSQPPATQLEYDDPDSTEARNMLMARMMGEKLDTGRKAIKEKAVTVGDFVGKPRTTRRSGKERGSFR
jgi:DNA replication regulator DPB11